jgi:dsDNA-specific endonuclease/ATPase MutS2
MKREEILEESKKQLENFKKEFDELKEKASHYSSEAKREFDERSVEVEELYRDALKGYESLKAKSEEGWHEVRDFALLTQKALRHSFNYFLSHYRKQQK